MQIHSKSGKRTCRLTVLELRHIQNALDTLTDMALVDPSLSQPVEEVKARVGLINKLTRTFSPMQEAS